MILDSLFPPVCTCGHARLQHDVPGNRCLGSDSYGIDCTCPGYEPESETEEVDGETLGAEYNIELTEYARRAAKRPPDWNRGD